MTQSFERQGRYIVLKISDLERAGIPQECMDALNYIMLRVAGYREYEAGKPPLQCVVVEHDWPEYEPTWAAIEARVCHGTNLRTRCAGSGKEPA